MQTNGQKFGLLYFAQHAQHLRKLGLSFVNAQYMPNICVRFSPQCAIYAQDCISSLNAQDCTSFPNAQYMHKIVLLLSPMCNICARFEQDCTSLPKCAIYAQDCRHYWKKYVTYRIPALNLEWYSLHSYFWIAVSFDVFLHKHL